MMRRFSGGAVLLAAALFLGSCGGKSGEIRIGEYGSLTGPTATFGKSTHNGITMAVNQVNESGGIGGAMLRVITEDDQGKPEEAATAVNKLISQDQVIEAGFSAAALDRAKKVVESFEQFIKDHKDEITALQILYSRPYKQRLKFEDVKELADAIEKPPYLWNESQLWQAYAALEKSKVKGASAKRILTDLVSLVRFATHQENELVPFPERVNANFKWWLATQERGGKRFTQEQMRWLEMIRDHVAANLSIEPSDFDYAPFAQQGGIGKGHQLFGDELGRLLEDLNGVLAA